MKLSFVFLIIFTSCQLQGQSNDTAKIFELNKNMIESFDSVKYEVKLNEKSKIGCIAIDFSGYNYIVIEGFSEKIPILNYTMAFRPPDIFVYKIKGKLCTSSGLIKLETKHLSEQDDRLNQLKKYFKSF